MDKILVLHDYDTPGAVSLTNNMENVLVDIERLLDIDLTEYPIIYKDTMGSYDRVYYSHRGVKFEPLREPKLEKAIGKIKLSL